MEKLKFGPTDFIFFLSLQFLFFRMQRQTEIACIEQYLCADVLKLIEEFAICTLNDKFFSFVQRQNRPWFLGGFGFIEFHKKTIVKNCLWQLKFDEKQISYIFTLKYKFAVSSKNFVLNEVDDFEAKIVDVAENLARELFVKELKRPIQSKFTFSSLREVIETIQ